MGSEEDSIVTEGMRDLNRHYLISTSQINLPPSLRTSTRHVLT